MIVYFLVFAFVIISPLKVSAQFCSIIKNGAKCKASTEVDEGIRVVWPQTYSGKIAFSTPLCLDSNKNPIVRTCCNGVWGYITTERCSFYAYEFGNKCPSNYTEIAVVNGTLCILLTQASAWNTACISSGTETTWFQLSMQTQESVLKYLQEKDVVSVWLPARRDGEYEPLTWMLIGNAWKRRVNGKHEQDVININSRGGNCLKMGSDGMAYELANCEEELPSLCVYDHDPLLPSDVRGSWLTRYSMQEYGYKIERTTSALLGSSTNTSLFNATSVESIYLFQNLATVEGLGTGDLCLVAGPRESPSYVVDHTGKLKVSYSYNCVVYRTSLKFNGPELILRFDVMKRKLLLIVYRLDSIWKGTNSERSFGIKCFSNSQGFLKDSKIRGLIWSGNYVVDGKEMTKHIFDIKLSGDSPGIHWCECFSLPNLLNIHSNKVVASKKDALTYAVMINFKGLFDVKMTSKNFRDHLRLHSDTPVTANISQSMTINLMKVVDLNSKGMNLLFHLTVFDGVQKIRSDLSDRVNEYYSTKAAIYELLSLSNSHEYTFISVNSTEYCLPDTNNRNWTSSKIGGRSLSRDFCLLGNGLPLTYKCIGDFLYGGIWETLDLSSVECETEVPEITKTLQNISLTAPEIKETVAAMSEMTSESQVIPSDVYFLAKTVHSIPHLSDTSQQLQIDDSYYNNLVLILNNLMEANETIVKQSQEQLNSTNLLVDGFDQIMNQMSFNVNEDGTILFITPRVIVLISDPNVADISGLALFSNSTVTDFTDFNVVKLKTNESVNRLLALQNLELATFVPQELLARINEVEILANSTSSTVPGTTKIVVTVYYNDVLFNTPNRLLSKVTSVTIPGYGTDLPVLLPTVFRSPGAGKCGYWAFDGWATDGCEYLGSNGDRIACGATHLTHFAYLVMGTYFHQDSEHRVVDIRKHTEALDIITFIGCTLSLFGILGIAITALVFKGWREKAGTKVLLHLSAAIALEMILIAFVNTESFSRDLIALNKITNCVILGASLHYSILVAFTWMLITALLQFMRYVKVLGETRPTHFLLKSIIIGWGGPLIPVLFIAYFYPDSYIPPVDVVLPGICYPKGNALYFGLILPVAVIVIANLVIFVIVIYNIFKIPELHIRTNERDLLVSQLRLSINLFFLLGLSWIFGLATVSKVGVIFSYLFCLTATLQGFVLFVYFIVMDPVTRKFWQLFLSNIGLNCFQRPKEMD